MKLIQNRLAIELLDTIKAVGTGEVAVGEAREKLRLAEDVLDKRRAQYEKALLDFKNEAIQEA